MNSTIQQLLAFLYGSERAAELATRIQELVVKYRGLIGQRERVPLDQRDVLVITYADQVRQGGQAPLASLYEFLRVHAGDFISGVHILPFYPSSSDDGFSVVDYYSVDPSFGTWEDVRLLGQGFDLMFDAVLNHISAQSSWFKHLLDGDPDFRDLAISVEGSPDLSAVIRPRTLPLLTEFQTAGGTRKIWTTFSADQVDLNYQNPQVLVRMLDVLLFYAAQGARFIRLDAVAFLWKEIGTTCLHLAQTHAVIQLIRAVLDEVAPHVLLITETNVPHADNISYFGGGRGEAQLVYNFALPPLVLHSFRANNANALTRWARTLSVPSDEVTFFNFLASHDGIGLNPARGIISEQEIEALVERIRAHGGLVSYKNNPDGSASPYELTINYFDALSSPFGIDPVETQVKRFATAQAIMLALAGVPGIYFHSLFGSRGDRSGAEASGIPRRINREKIERAVLESALASPNSLQSLVFGRLAELLRVRRSHPAFHPHAAQRILDCDPHLFSVERTAIDGTERILCLHNVSGEVVQPSPSILANANNAQKLAGEGDYRSDGQGELAVELGPYEMLWLHDRP